MDVRRRSMVLGLVLFAGVSRALLAQSTLATPPSLSGEQLETFLLKARISNQRDAGGGVTGSRRATASDGQVTHDVHIQTIDEAKAVFEAGRNTELNFKDTYRYNIGGYHVARLIGLTNVPMSVERAIDGKMAAVTWWVDDVKMDEKDRTKAKTLGPDPVKTTKQLQIMRVFDELIQNKDRNQGNILWTSDFTMWLIDHTRAFRLGRSLLKPENLTRCDRGLLERLRALTPESLAQAVGGSLTKQEQEALMIRRDLIVKHYDDRIARLGEPVVLFTMYETQTQDSNKSARTGAYVVASARRATRHCLSLNSSFGYQWHRHGERLAAIEIDRGHLVTLHLQSRGDSTRIELSVHHAGVDLNDAAPEACVDSPGQTVVWPITMARARMRSRIRSSVGASSASGSLARPLYQSGPVSLAEKSVGTCSSGTGNERRSLRTAALIPSHPSAAAASLIPPCRKRMPLMRATAAR